MDEDLEAEIYENDLEEWGNREAFEDMIADRDEWGESEWGDED